MLTRASGVNLYFAGGGNGSRPYMSHIGNRDLLPGDTQYIVNPGAEGTDWQGENLIVGIGDVYGHPFGFKSRDYIVGKLNEAAGSKKQAAIDNKFDIRVHATESNDCE